MNKRFAWIKTHLSYPSILYVTRYLNGAAELLSSALHMHVFNCWCYKSLFWKSQFKTWLCIFIAEVWLRNSETFLPFCWVSTSAKSRVNALTARYYGFCLVVCKCCICYEQRVRPSYVRWLLQSFQCPFFTLNWWSDPCTCMWYGMCWWFTGSENVHNVPFASMSFHRFLRRVCPDYIPLATIISGWCYSSW
jgi:hypothetical protein